MGRAEASSIHFVGQFLSYDLKGCEIHRIHLGDAGGKYCFKLNGKGRKALLRTALQGKLQVGDWVKVSGNQTSESQASAQTGQWTRFKVKAVKRVSVPKKAEASSKKARKVTAPKGVAPKIKVSVCQKSGCCKRGGKAMYEMLTRTVKKHQLDGRVRIKATGCLGKCSKGPNIVVNETRHHHMHSKNVGNVLATYLS